MFADEKTGCTCYDETTRTCPVHTGSSESKVVPITAGPKPVRTFATGATRDSDAGKLDYEGFLSSAVLERYAEYMHLHRLQPDGRLRDSDNWQKGIPRDQYMKSLWRHFVDLWKLHRGYPAKDRVTGHEVTLEDALCAVLFNVMGYLHEHLKDKRAEAPPNG